MKFTKTIAQIALVLSVLPLAAMADEAGTIYTQISSNGLGLGYAKSVGDDFAVRGQINSYEYSFSGDVGDFGANATKDVKLSLNSVQVLGDWYPGAGSWRLSGGLVFNDNKVTLKATNATVGTVTGASASAEVKLSNSVSPYLGVGFSTRPKNAKGFGFNFDLGVMFQDPTVTLTATLPGSTVPQGDIDAQKKKMQDAVDQLKNMPVLGLGVSYAF